jgi:hypothetical protein
LTYSSVARKVTLYKNNCIILTLWYNSTMIEFGTAKVNRVNGLIPIPKEIREQQGIEPGTVLVKAAWAENHVLVPPGAEIVLFSLLVGDKGIVSDAASGTPSANRSYTSPLSRVFYRTEVNSMNRVQIGRGYIGEMAVFPIGDGVLITPITDAESVYDGLQVPGHSEFDWARTPEVTAQALAESYFIWHREKAKELAKTILGKGSFNGLPAYNNGLQKRVIYEVAGNIANSAGDMLRHRQDLI